MQYFQAVQIGKKRANKAQMVLFDISGFAMLTLTTKKIDGKFVPVGEESFTTVIKTDDGFVILLVDTDGFTKAQTKALEKEEAQKIFNKVLASGIAEFPNKEIKIWTDTYPTVQDEVKYSAHGTIWVPTGCPFIAFSIVLMSALIIFVLIFDLSITFSATISIRS